MTDLEAAVGLPQLARVDENWERRRTLWRAYMDALRATPLTLPAEVPADVRHAHHLFTVLVDEARCGLDRDAFLDETIARGVGVGVHYRSIPEHRYYRERFGWNVEDYPNAARIGRQTASLPLGAVMNDADVAAVVETVAQVLASAR